MRVRRIRGAGVACLDEPFDIRLPDNGIVVVTGKNGAGKSSGFIESLTTCCWGKSLRSASMWFPKRNGYLDVELDRVIVKRTFDGRKATLMWNIEGRDPDLYETNTKAQDALSATIGDFDVWRKTCVFSSQDASHFTRATDSERKRLLEELLNLDQFTPAYEATHKELKSANRELSAMELERGSRASTIKSLRENVAHVTSLLEAKREDYKRALKLYKSVDVASLGSEIEDLKLSAATLTEQVNSRQGEIRSSQVSLRELQSKISDANVTSAKLESRMQHLKSHFEALSESKCPTCGQEVNDISAATQKRLLKDEYKELKQNLKLLQDTLSVQVDSAKTLEGSIEDQLAQQEKSLKKRDKAITRIAQLTAAQGHVVSLKQQVDDYQAMIDKSNAEIHKIESEAAQLEEAYAKKKAEVEMFEQAAKVLGTGGFRAALLTEILDSLAIMANKWLEKLTGKAVHVALTPYTENKTGGVSDSLSLQILGLGLEDYRSLSGGERRRVDIAMLFALADISAAAYGAKPGTLFLDEVTDAPLDDEGADMLVDAMLELSKTRPIVAICHSQYAIGRLKPKSTGHYHVEDGKISIRD